MEVKKYPLYTNIYINSRYIHTRNFYGDTIHFLPRVSGSSLRTEDFNCRINDLRSAFGMR